MLYQRHWTPEQANHVLPLVGERVRAVRDARRRLAERTLEPGFEGWPGIDHARDAVEVVLGFDWLEKLDIVVRDLERGLVDFPALIDGSEVYLCWLLDEPAVGHWHAIEGGFAGRRPL